MWSNSRQCIHCVASIDMVNSFMVGLLLNNKEKESTDLFIVFDYENQFGRGVRGRFELESLIEHCTKILSGFCLKQEIIIANTLLHVGQYEGVSYLISQLDYKNDTWQHDLIT